MEVSKNKLEGFRRPMEEDIASVSLAGAGNIFKGASKYMNFVRIFLVLIVASIFLNNTLVQSVDLPRGVTFVFTAIALISAIGLSVSMVLSVRKSMAAFSLQRNDFTVIDVQEVVNLKEGKGYNLLKIKTSEGVVCKDYFPLSCDTVFDELILIQTRFGGEFKLVPKGKNIPEEGSMATESKEE